MVKRGSGYTPGIRHWIVGGMTTGHNACGAPISKGTRMNGTRNRANVTCQICLDKS